MNNSETRALLLGISIGMYNGVVPIEIADVVYRLRRNRPVSDLEVTLALSTMDVLMKKTPQEDNWKAIYRQLCPDRYLIDDIDSCEVN